jgi:multiple antibiotic resistance protein
MGRAINLICLPCRPRAGQRKRSDSRGSRLQNMPAALATVALAGTPANSWAQGAAPVPGVIEYFPMTHIATFLVLMLGPSKIIAPFVSLTAGADTTLERKIALLAVAFSGAALLLAGFFGESIISKYGIPLPILALSGGVILFVVALSETTRPLKSERPGDAPSGRAPPKVRSALTPLAFPTIVPPHGIAALVVFLAFTPGLTGRMMIGLIVVGILLADLLVMIIARRLVAAIGTVLAVVGAVLGIVQVALGLQIIYNSLIALGLL